MHKIYRNFCPKNRLHFFSKKNCSPKKPFSLPTQKIKKKNPPPPPPQQKNKQTPQTSPPARYCSPPPAHALIPRGAQTPRAICHWKGCVADIQSDALFTGVSGIVGTSRHPCARSVGGHRLSRVCDLERLASRECSSLALWRSARVLYCYGLVAVGHMIAWWARAC